MQPLDRVALVLTPKRRFLEWANGLPDIQNRLVPDALASYRSIYLVAAPEGSDLQELIDTYCDDLFETCLRTWTADDTLWPVNRTPHVFRDWFQVEAIDSVIDADPFEPLLVLDRLRRQCANCREELPADPIFLGLASGAMRRLTADEVQRWSDEDGPPDELMDILLILRACSEECAAEIQQTWVNEPAEIPQTDT